MEFQRKGKYSMDDLLRIIADLRSPEGCPWDREQTHQSLRGCLLEETYETAEAIDEQDAAHLQEELGDVLFQVLFHAQLESEQGRFDFSDVADGIARKMVLRHPHVFGGASVSGAEEALVGWDAVKRKTRRQKTQTEVLEGISRALPALMRAAKVQDKAEKAGADGPELSEALESVARQARRVNRPEKTCSREEAARQIGDLLFSAVYAARLLGVDPERELAFACDRFILQFARAERRKAE